MPFLDEVHSVLGQNATQIKSLTEGQSKLMSGFGDILSELKRVRFEEKISTPTRIPALTSPNMSSPRVNGLDMRDLTPATSSRIPPRKIERRASSTGSVVGSKIPTPRNGTPLKKVDPKRKLDLSTA
ncbi:hypothetical protein LTS18_013699 [Coniosporium uncinatum]|uniref:Uncharacterized protein n=1 Tax=Coniosporium uncinatum TaxID=93489 RepID=A0ACC3DHU2_9PEZI|nr:hypothetical protein LTS18_013699 [Coniosporium uncinatum]